MNRVSIFITTRICLGNYIRVIFVKISMSGSGMLKRLTNAEKTWSSLNAPMERSCKNCMHYSTHSMHPWASVEICSAFGNRVRHDKTGKAGINCLTGSKNKLYKDHWEFDGKR